MIIMTFHFCFMFIKSNHKWIIFYDSDQSIKNQSYEPENEIYVDIYIQKSNLDPNKHNFNKWHSDFLSGIKVYERNYVW